jgi:hypothetical protein
MHGRSFPDCGDMEDVGILVLEMPQS